MTRPAVEGVAAPEALFFDVFGTLVDWRTSVARDVKTLLADEITETVALAFTDRWRSLYQPFLEPVREGRRPYVRLDVLHGENLEVVLEEFEVRALPPADREWLADAWSRLDPWPDVVAGLERLSRRYLLAPVSNGSVAMMARLARWSGMRWHAVLGADIAGVYKPDPRVYLASAEWLGLPPERCMMVAAHGRDLEVASGLGLMAAFVHRPLEHGPQRGVEGAPGCADVAVGSLDELAERLGR